MVMCNGNRICANCLWMDMCSTSDMESVACCGCDYYDCDSVNCGHEIMWRDEIDKFIQEWYRYTTQYDGFCG